MALRALVSLVGGCALAAAGTGAVAQDYPNRTIKILQGYAPGGNADTIARIIAGPLSDALGQPVIVEARPGAGGNLATDAAAKAPPDGYTLVLLTGGHAVSGALYKSLPFHPVDSLDFISTTVLITFLISARTDGKAVSLQALVQQAKAAPDTVAYGTAGIGSTNHLVGELLGSMAGVQFLHVPYKGDSAALAGLLGGETAFMVSSPATVLSHIKSGKLKPVAVSASSRWQGLPEVPTVEEAGVAGFDVRSWAGFASSRGTPRPVVERLNAEVRRALQQPEVRAKLEAIGTEVSPSTPEEFRARVATDVQRWTKVVTDAKIPQQ